VSTQLEKILTSFALIVAKDPGFFTVPDFSAALFRVIDVCPNPPDFVANFPAAFGTMAQWLIVSTDVRNVAELFFQRLFIPGEAAVNFDCVFSSLASLYSATDRGPQRYVQLVNSVLGIAARKPAISIEEGAILATMVRPLLQFRDGRSREAIKKFVGTLGKMAVAVDGDAFEQILGWMTEFSFGEPGHNA
jgi:hypothetical protein